MKHHRPVLAIIALLSALSMGCSEDKVNEEKKTKTVEQELIFNTFNSIHEGYLAAEANRAELVSDDKNALLHYRAMMMARSSLEIEVPKMELEDTSCVSGSITQASANLSSPTRATTAWHAINDLDPSQTASQLAYFEGRDDTTFHENVSGGLWYDNGTNDDYEENPLFPNRLFSLGLDEYASSKLNMRRDIRNPLRTWPYSVDVDWQSQGLMTDFTHSIQGIDVAIIEINRNLDFWATEEGVIDWKNKNTNDSLISGPFPLDNPGAFFNITIPYSWQEDVRNCKRFPSNTDRLYASIARHFDVTGTNSIAKLMSPGFHTNAFYNRDNDNVCMSNGTIRDVKYYKMMPITSDIVSGASGGAVLGRPCKVETDSTGEHVFNGPMPSSLASIGVIAAGVDFLAFPDDGTWATQQPIPFYSVSQLDMGDMGDMGDMNPPTECDNDFSFPYEDYCEAGHTGFNDGEAMNFFQPFNQTATMWAKRTTDYSGANNPFAPVPSEPDTDGCPGNIVNGNCIVSVSESESSGPGAYMPTGRTPPALTVNVDDPDDEGDAGVVNQGRINEYQSGLNGNVSVQWCNSFIGEGEGHLISSDNELSRFIGSKRRVNMMQGLAGSLKNTEVNEENGFVPQPTNTNHRVDAFSQVCVPWSSAAWTSHWEWASVFVGASSRISNQAEALLVENGLFDNQGWRLLKEILILVTEKRKVAVTIDGEDPENTSDFFHQFRPISMKNCPPNYYLNGVKYWTNRPEEGEDRVLMGIEKLFCKAHYPSREAYGKDLVVNIEAPLTAPKSTFDYKMALPNDVVVYPNVGVNSYADFELTQYIGYPTPDPATTDRGVTECDDDHVATAMLVGRNSNNDVNFLKFLCIPAPAGPSTN